MLITKRRLGAALTGAALILSPLAVTPSAGAATTTTYDPAPLAQGIDWITGRLSNGALSTAYGPDYSTTAYLAIALQRIGGHDGELAPIVDSLEAHAKEQVSGSPTGTDIYPGSAAKLAVLVQAAGDDPTNVGGMNLIDTIEGRVGADGRTSDQSAWGDYANTIGQAYAAHALTTAGSSKAASVTSFLLEQQCAAGWFRLNFSAPSSATQTCDTDTASKPDPDSTSFAILELAGMAGSNPTVAAALTRAQDWLATQQKSDGSFGGGTSTEASNTNSTGLAGWALGERGDTARAERAARWLRTVQAHEPVGCPTKLTGQTGAIAYSPAELRNGRTAGIADAYQWQLAAAQALPALKWLPATTAKPVVSGPTGYLGGGTTATYRVTGATAGTPLCVSAGTAKKLVTAASSGSATAALRLPARTVNLTASVADHAGVTSRTVTKVLGATAPRVRLSRTTVRRGQVLVVRVAGLASGERVSVKFRRSTVKRGLTTSTGRYTARVRITKTLAKRLGRARVTVTGQFADRTNHKTVKVVR